KPGSTLSRLSALLRVEMRRKIRRGRPAMVVHSVERMEANRLTGVVLASLDDNEATDDLARRAHHSRAQFYRVFRALIEESPGTMRRRVLLGRAAWELSRTRDSIAGSAILAGYGWLEAFPRAFRKAFRASPRLYRR